MMDKNYDGAQDYDFVLRCVETVGVENVYHIPKALYHWRKHAQSTASNPESKLYAFEAGKRAIQAYYDRNGIDAEVEMGSILGFYRTRYAIKDEALVSILIPNKDHIDDLKRCITSIENKSTYKNYEFIIIENNSELEEKNPETFLKVFSLNTLAPFLLMKMFGKEINQNYGSIINISSDNTLGKNDPRTMEYDVSKAGLNMLTKDFALELPHVHVNAIAFGWLDTKMNDIPEDIKKYIKFVPLEKATKEILTFLDSKETGIIKEVSE